MRNRLWPAALVFLAAVGTAFGEEIPLKDWTVPQYSLSGLGKAVDATPPRAFIGLPPCRIADTRGGAPHTGGIFTGGSDVRNWNMVNLCGVPVGTDAVSLNFTVTGPTASGFLTAWPTGGAVPASSILNFAAGQQVANAAILPLGAGGSITVNVSAPTHVILDINGYFSDVSVTPGSLFRFQGNVPSNGVIVGENNNTGFLAAGILGRITSTSPSAGSAGLRGINNGTGPGGVGVWGSQAGSGWGVHGEATGTSGSGSKGVFGTSASANDNSIGVHGLAEATTGRTYGVWGETNSEAANAAGVFGVEGSGIAGGTLASAGVRGESAEHFGVLGVSRGRGVQGSLVNNAGQLLAGGVLGVPSGTAGVTYGVYSFGDLGGSGAKNFVEPHPLQAGMVIRYVSLEGPESGTYFRGKGKFQNGMATIDVPEDFRLVTDAEGLSVQVTPIGGMASVGVLRIGLDAIVVQGSRNLEFFYLVNGVRRSHKHLKPVGPGQEFMPETPESTMPAYLTEVQKEMLISNGTYKADGTVNMETAEALGWTKLWENRAGKAKANKKEKAASRVQEEN